MSLKYFLVMIGRGADLLPFEVRVGLYGFEFPFVYLLGLMYDICYLFTFVDLLEYRYGEY